MFQKVQDFWLNLKQNPLTIRTKYYEISDILGQDKGEKSGRLYLAFSNVMKLEDYNDMSNITYQKHNYSEKTQIIKDLHQDKIQKYNTSLNTSEVLRKQILIINDTIEKAFKLNNENIEIIFIHGLGSGRLKSELHYILKEKDLDYKEVRGGVATKILIWIIFY